MSALATELRRHTDAMYRAGDLRWKFAVHTQPFYDSFRAWNVQRQERSYLDRMREANLQFDNLWVNRWARRVHKTSSTLLLGQEESTRFANRFGRGAHGMIAIPVQKKIGGVLVPLTRQLFGDAPKGYFPEYRGSGQGLHEHLYIPAIESRITLVGLDHHARALAGTYLDWFGFTEAGFATDGLYETYVSVIKDQFQGRPWAWSLLESSEPEIQGHDFNLHFVPDAKARGAYWSMTIEDNTSLTREEIEDEVRRSGGRGTPACDRELFNIVIPDFDTMVCPEFSEAIHVVDPNDYPQPEHAMGYAGLDPGTTDPFGLVGFYLDWMRQQVIVQFSWQKANASLGEVAKTLRSYERQAWGTEHALPLDEVHHPGDGFARVSGARLTRIHAAAPREDGSVWQPPAGALTYWDPDTWSLKPNPCSRVSDVQNATLGAFNKDYAMNVVPASKQQGSAEADMQHLRRLFAARHEDGRPKIVVLKNGQTEVLIEQLRDGRIKRNEDGKMVDWARSKRLGHLDCVAALKYVLRDVKWNRNPFPPASLWWDRSNMVVNEEPSKQSAVETAISVRQFRQGSSRHAAVGGSERRWRQ